MFAKLLSVVLRSVVLVLNAVCLSYIYKLEKTGCPCAASPYRNFLKGYMIFAIAYLVLMILLTGAFAKGGVAQVVIDVLFTLATVVFFILAIVYIRRLVQEKCACSEDVRREVLFYWSIIQLSLMGIVIILPHHRSGGFWHRADKLQWQEADEL